jgi:alpha-ketoglutarate-dependent taurine dioxygenase
MRRPPRFAIRIRLDAGMMSAFDNRRVLHRRAAFGERGGRPRSGAPWSSR